MATRAIGVDQDIAGGVVTPKTDANTGKPLATTLINGRRVICVGDPVGPHYHGDDVITSTMQEGSAAFTDGGRQVCVDGDAAACGHALSATHQSIASVRSA